MYEIVSCYVLTYENIIKSIKSRLVELVSSSAYGKVFVLFAKN